MCIKQCWAHEITGTQRLLILQSPEAIICMTELELCAAYILPYMQSEKLTCTMVNHQQKGNRCEESVEGILTEIICNAMKLLMTPPGTSLLTKLNIQLLQRIYRWNTS
jgi:hypothetical protein